MTDNRNSKQRSPNLVVTCVIMASPVFSSPFATDGWILKEG